MKIGRQQRRTAWALPSVLLLLVAQGLSCSSGSSSQGGSSASGHLVQQTTATATAAASAEPEVEPTEVPCEGATTVAKVGSLAPAGSKPGSAIVVFEVAAGAEKPRLCRSVEDKAASVYVNVVGGEAGVVTATDVTAAARDTVKPALEKLGARVTLVRGADTVLAIYVDQARRQKLGVEMDQVIALMRSNKEPALPRIGELVIPGPKTPVSLSAVASIEMTIEEVRTPTALAPGGAVLAVSAIDPAPLLRARVDAELAKVAASMPPTVTVSRMSFARP